MTDVPQITDVPPQIIDQPSQSAPTGIGINILSPTIILALVFIIIVLIIINIRTNKKEYSRELGMVGFFAGGWVGYVLRPSLKAFGLEAQLPPSAIISFFTEKTMNPIEQSLAQSSIEFIITGLILGTIIGWIVGKFVEKKGD